MAKLTKKVATDTMENERLEPKDQTFFEKERSFSNQISCFGVHGSIVELIWRVDSQYFWGC